MKHFFPLLLLLASACPAAAQAPVRQALPVRAVTLYAETAELHHEGSLTLSAGTSKVQVTGLDAHFEAASLQAEAGGAELQGVEVVAGPAPIGGQADTLRRLRREHTALVAEREFLTQNARLPNTVPGRWVEEMQRGAAYYSARVSALKARQETIEAQLSALGYDARSTTPPPAGRAPAEVLLTVRVRQAGPVRLRLSYRLAGSTATGWTPTYELRVEERNLRELRVVSRAEVRNHTSLSWASVPVTLRTTPDDPDNEPGLTRPALDPWAVAYGSGGEGEGRLNDYAVKGPGTAGDTTAAPSATGPSLGLDVLLPTPVTLAAGAHETYQLADYHLPMRLEYLAVPKRVRQVLLLGRVGNWNQVNFLAEQATVFYRGTYVGTTTLNTRAYSDTLEVALGRDPQVQLTRTKRVDFKARVGSRERNRLVYEIYVRNTHAYPVRLRLLDQVPIAQEKDITVKVKTISGATLDEASGRLTWLLALAAGASSRLPIDFTVEAPADKTLNLRRDRRVRSPRFR